MVMTGKGRISAIIHDRTYNFQRESKNVHGEITEKDTGEFFNSKLAGNKFSWPVICLLCWGHNFSWVVNYEGV